MIDFLKLTNIQHAAIFCFQQQNEISDPDSLFHRQKIIDIMGSIRYTLPYF